jgi:hypothetical protein
MITNLTEHQQEQIFKASGWVLPTKRVAFVKSVESRLRDLSFVTGGDLALAISFTLSCFGVSAPFINRKQHKEIRP